jgi:hypothetical protein
MLRTIPAADVYLDGTALAVRYKGDPARPDLLLVSVTAHRTDGEADHVRQSEVRLVAVAESMTREAMHARVTAEAARRAIEQVAWIEEG